jgi:hypothetical protein
MKRRMRIFLIVTAVLLLSTSLVLAVSADSVLVFDAGDLPDTYKGFLLKGVSTDGGSSYPFSDDFTVSYNSADAQEYYTLLMVKASVNESGGLDTAYEITEDNILYIDQKSSEADGSVSFDVRPSSVESSVFLLGGSFDQSGETSPVMLGAVHLSGVEVSGTVALQGRTSGKLDQVSLMLTPAAGDPLNVLTDASGNYAFTGVPQATYHLKAEKAGYLSYEKLALPVTVDAILGEISLKGGDVNSDGQVTSTDLSTLLSLYLNTTTAVSDINGDGQVTSTDLSILLANYLVSKTVEE